MFLEILFIILHSLKVDNKKINKKNTFPCVTSIKFSVLVVQRKHFGWKPQIVLTLMEAASGFCRRGRGESVLQHPQYIIIRASKLKLYGSVGSYCILGLHLIYI